jgi:oligopeptide transport system substrate-binding protein
LARSNRNASPALGVLLLLLAACSGGETDRVGRVIPPERPVLRVAVGEDPAGLDPTRYAQQDAWRVARLLFEGLTVLGPDGSPRPGVAEAWGSDVEARQWIFHLRDEARWSDGEPVTAGDFRYAWQRTLDPATGAESAEYLYPLRGAAAINRGERALATLGVRVIDDATLVVLLDEADPDLPRRVALPPFFPVPEHIVTADPIGWPAGGSPVGNGPFTLVTWRANDRLETVRSETYWGRDRVALEGVVLFPLEDPGTVFNLYRSGTLDWTTAFTIPNDEARRLLEAGAPEAVATGVFQVYYLEVNTRRAPTDDGRVRRALELSLPREAVAGSIFGFGQRAQRSFTTPDLPDWEPPAPPAGGLDEARRLLAEAGYPDGEGLGELTYLYNVGAAHAAVAEYLQGFWQRELGVRLVLVPMDFPSMEARALQGDYHLKRSGWLADLPDPSAFLTVFEGNNPNNPTGWHSPAYDRLMGAARRSADPVERRRLLQEAETLLLADAPILPIFQNATVQLIKPYVTGIVPNPLDVVDWREVRIEVSGRPR